MDSAAYVTKTHSRLVEVATRHSQGSTRPGYMVVTHRTTDVSPYRTIGTASSKPRTEATVRNPHHLARGYLPSYLGVGALLQKVNTKSKSLLACHLLRLL
jgi:hypothetical protein